MTHDQNLVRLLVLSADLEASGQLMQVVAAGVERKARALQSAIQEQANLTNVALPAVVSNAIDKAACSNSKDTALTLKTSETFSERIEL